MSGGDPRGQFIYNLPSSVLWEFCRVMDGLSDLDWTRFASEVLRDQTSLRLAEREDRRTDYVMNQWGIRNGRVGELIDLLESLQLFRPRDVVLSWLSAVAPPPPAPSPPPPLRPAGPAPSCPPASSLPWLPPATADWSDGKGEGRCLPGPARPPTDLYSVDPPQEAPPAIGDGNAAIAAGPSSVGGAVMCWAYEEVHDGTRGFSPALQVGEGGFGVVYRATLRSMDCAVKRLRQDSLMDSSVLRKSFLTEVEKLSKFRHTNIVDLLGFSEGGGSMCLIYSFMSNRSLEDQLHSDCCSLSWSHRVGVLKGAATALEFLHCPPAGQEPLIHGDVKSSNILLDQHLVAKLSDFGLARLAPPGPARFGPNGPGGGSSSFTQTASIGRTATVRGTLAYLPDEYVRRGELCTALDVYSFGVVLLEVLTGRRALEKDKKSGDKYLRSLVEELEGGPNGPMEEAWRNQLDRRLLPDGAADPVGWRDVAVLACWSLHSRRKKRPAMAEVCGGLQEVQRRVLDPIRAQLDPLDHLDPSVALLSQKMARLGPLEHSYPPSSSSSSSSLPPLSSSSSSSLPPPSSSSSSSSLPPPSCSSSFLGPCETDESRGFSQYQLRSPSPRDQSPVPAQPSVPTEDQYSQYFQSSQCCPQDAAGLSGFSQAAPLQSLLPRPSAHMSPLSPMGRKNQNEKGRIRTPEQLSSDELYAGTGSVDLRGPEESDELDFLPAKHT